MIKNKEIEFKYAAEVTLTEFKDFAEKRTPLKFILISGWDHFYSKPDDRNSFYRHRVNTNENQLTFKRKTTAENSFVREEHNVDLPLSVSTDKINALCAINGYLYDTSIFKNCFIYNYSNYTLVYYICYDKDMNEFGRFIEIEMSENYDWINESEAFNELTIVEKLSRDLKVNSKKRITESLYEMRRGKL